MISTTICAAQISKDETNISVSGDVCSGDLLKKRKKQVVCSSVIVSSVRRQWQVSAGILFGSSGDDAMASPVAGRSSRKCCWLMALSFDCIFELFLIYSLHRYLVHYFDSSQSLVGRPVSGSLIYRLVQDYEQCFCTPAFLVFLQ